MSQRITRAASSKKKENVDSNNTVDSAALDVDCSKLSTKEILDFVIARNKDPVIGKFMQTLADRLPGEIADCVEADRRARSVVIAGVAEPRESRPSVRQSLDEEKVSEILDVLGVQCRPNDVYRLGKFDESKPRLLKVVLPSRSHWSTVLANAHRLRSSEFSRIFVRRSMTPAERQKDFDLRQEARDRNGKAGSRQWVVYRGELRKTSELPLKATSSGSGNV